MRYVKILVAVCAFVTVFFLLQRLLVPKYVSNVPEGNLIREYYLSDKNHDIIFIGDCEVYANFSPISLWEEFGVTSFIRGSPQQLVWQSYYLLQDTLRFETPQIVIFNVLAMQYNEPQHEPYNRLTLDGMQMSRVKLNAISASRTDEEDFLSYIFPLLRFKDRWRELTREDVRYMFRTPPRVSMNGFMIRSDVMPAGFIPEFVISPGFNFTFGDKAYYYLERMVLLTQEHGIKLVLVKAPTLFPYWPAQWEEQIVAFAQEHDLLYINFLNYIDEIGLDFATDTFNGGLHLNVFGAEKVASFLGTRLQQHVDLPDRRNDPEVSARWNAKSELYRHVIARQQEEIARYGQIQSIFVEW